MAAACNHNPSTFIDFLFSPCDKNGDGATTHLTHPYVSELFLSVGILCDVNETTQAICAQWSRFEAVCEDCIQHPNTRNVGQRACVNSRRTAS